MGVELIPITPPTAGSYVTQADLQAVIPADLFLQVFDRDGDQVADAAVMAAAIAAAESDVHGYLARRYQLPLDAGDATLMAFLKPGLVDLAWAMGHPRADMVNAKLQGRVEAFRTKLAAIRDGKADLPAANPVASGTGTGGGGSAIRHASSPRKTLGGMP